MEVYKPYLIQQGFLSVIPDIPGKKVNDQNDAKTLKREKRRINERKMSPKNEFIIYET